MATTTATEEESKTAEATNENPTAITRKWNLVSFKTGKLIEVADEDVV